MRNKDGDVLLYEDDGGMLASIEGSPGPAIQIGQVVWWYYGKNPNANRHYGYVADFISPTTAWLAFFGGGGYGTHAVANLRACPEFIVPRTGGILLDPQPVPGAATVPVDREWFFHAMRLIGGAS